MIGIVDIVMHFVGHKLVCLSSALEVVTVLAEKIFSVDDEVAASDQAERGTILHERVTHRFIILICVLERRLVGRGVQGHRVSVQRNDELVVNDWLGVIVFTNGQKFSINTMDPLKLGCVWNAHVVALNRSRIMLQCRIFGFFDLVGFPRCDVVSVCKHRQWLCDLECLSLGPLPLHETSLLKNLIAILLEV